MTAPAAVDSRSRMSAAAAVTRTPGGPASQGAPRSLAAAMAAWFVVLAAVGVGRLRGRSTAARRSPSDALAGRRLVRRAVASRSSPADGRRHEARDRFVPPSGQPHRLGRDWEQRPVVNRPGVGVSAVGGEVDVRREGRARARGWGRRQEARDAALALHQHGSAGVRDEGGDVGRTAGARAAAAEGCCVQSPRGAGRGSARQAERLRHRDCDAVAVCSPRSTRVQGAPRASIRCGVGLRPRPGTRLAGRPRRGGAGALTDDSARCVTPAGSRPGSGRATGWGAVRGALRRRPLSGARAGRRLRRRGQLAGRLGSGGVGTDGDARRVACAGDRSASGCASGRGACHGGGRRVCGVAAALRVRRRVADAHLAEPVHRVPHGLEPAEIAAHVPLCRLRGSSPACAALEQADGAALRDGVQVVALPAGREVVDARPRGACRPQEIVCAPAPLCLVRPRPQRGPRRAASGSRLRRARRIEERLKPARLSEDERSSRGGAWSARPRV